MMNKPTPCKGLHDMGRGFTDQGFRIRTHVFRPRTGACRGFWMLSLGFGMYLEGHGHFPVVLGIWVIVILVQILGKYMIMKPWG